MFDKIIKLSLDNKLLVLLSVLALVVMGIFSAGISIAATDRLSRASRESKSDARRSWDR